MSGHKKRSIRRARGARGVRRHVIGADLDAGYRAMAADAAHEREAAERVEGTGDGSLDIPDAVVTA